MGQVIPYICAYTSGHRDSDLINHLITQVLTMLKALLPYRLFLLLSVTLLTGCAHLSATPDADGLRQRAEAYWKVRLAGDLVAAWDFEEAKARRQLTLAQYAKGSGMMFTKVVVTGATLEAEGKGSVTMETEYFVPGLKSKKPLQQTLSDPWVWIDNQWYHVHVRAIPGATQ